MEALAPFHPQIVHTPVALIIFSAAFMLVGRLTDLSWWRKAATALLVIGFLGGVAAFYSGDAASDRAEHAGVPESAVDPHEDAARTTLWLAGGALVLMFAGARVRRPAAGVLSGLGLVLQLAAAVAVGVTGYRGGRLVYEYGANVHVRATTKGAPAIERDSTGAAHERGEREEHGEHAEGDER